MKKTPLEIAMERKLNPICNDTTNIYGVLYCNKSGKIILHMFTVNEENKICNIKKCRNNKAGGLNEVEK